MPRRAKSVLLQVLDGNPNNKTKKELQKRAKNEKKFDFGTDKLVPPRWLSKKGKDIFKTIVDIYKGTTFLNNADLVTLSLYCDWYSEYLACNTRLKRLGRTKNGKPSGDMQLKLKISAELDKLGRELGLTPSSRASLSIHLEGELDKAQKDQWNKEDSREDDEFEE